MPQRFKRAAISTAIHMCCELGSPVLQLKLTMLNIFMESVRFFSALLSSPLCILSRPAAEPRCVRPVPVTFYGCARQDREEYNVRNMAREVSHVVSRAGSEGTEETTWTGRTAWAGSGWSIGGSTRPASSAAS